MKEISIKPYNYDVNEMMSSVHSPYEDKKQRNSLPPSAVQKQYIAYVITLTPGMIISHHHQNYSRKPTPGMMNDSMN